MKFDPPGALLGYCGSFALGCVVVAAFCSPAEKPPTAREPETLHDAVVALHAEVFKPHEPKPQTSSDAARFARGAAIDLGYRVAGIHCADSIDGVTARCLLRLRDDGGNEELVSWACGPGGGCWAVSAP